MMLLHKGWIHDGDKWLSEAHGFCLCVHYNRPGGRYGFYSFTLRRRADGVEVMRSRMAIPYLYDAMRRAVRTAHRIRARA